MGLLTDIIKFIRDPDIIRRQKAEIDKLERFNFNCDIVKIPSDIHTGDKIYYVATDVLPDEKMQDSIIAIAYSDTINRLVELTVDHFVIKNGTVYYAVLEVDTLFYINDPCITTDFSDAYNRTRTLSVSNQNIDIVTEFTNNRKTPIRPYTFNLPAYVGSSIFHKLSVEGSDVFYEYEIIGYKYTEPEGMTIMAMDVDGDTIDYISINDIGSNWVLVDSK